MHSIEPYFQWSNLYCASTDDRSPFYGTEHSEFEFNNKIYDHVIHPQWDNIGSPTLFLKVLYADYDEGYTVIELIGEWNDCLHNDIMFLKREIADEMLYQGINKFILIGENVLNFHGSDDCYYEEWSEELGDGWIVAMNFQEHVKHELFQFGVNNYFTFQEAFFEFPWRTYRPLQLFQKIEQLLPKNIEVVVEYR